VGALDKNNNSWFEKRFCKTINFEAIEISKPAKGGYVDGGESQKVHALIYIFLKPNQK